MKLPYLTIHAEQRWDERFSGDLWEAFKRSVPFGGQKGKDKALLDMESGAVFIITPDYSIKTVLTKHQYLVNIQSIHGRDIQFQIDPPKPPPKPEEKRYSKEELDRLAREHIEKYGPSYCKNNRKKFNKELRELGIGDNSKNKAIYHEYLFKYIRAHHVLNA
jgi:hypothetical protein